MRESRRSGASQIAVTDILAVMLAAAATLLTRCGGGVAMPGEGVAKPTGSQPISWSLSVHGVERQYLVHVPEHAPSADRMPVVISLHGGGADANWQMKRTGMNATSDKYGFLAVYPQGTRAVVGKARTWNAGSCCGRAKRNNVDDVGYIRALLDDLEQHYAVDPARIYATGMSNGAMMAYRLACQLADRIAAVSAVAGTLGIDDCVPSRPISVLHFHGTADQYVPYDGGYGRTRSSGSFRSVDDSLEIFVKRNGCAPEPEVLFTRGNVSYIRYPSGANGTQVDLCLIEGGGHTWPGGIPYPAGDVTTNDISANEASWSFFQSQALPAS